VNTLVGVIGGLILLYFLVAALQKSGRL